MEDKVLTFSFGKFGVILTRRMLMYLVMVMTAVLAIYAFVLVEEGHNHQIVPISEYSWNDYIGDCGM